MSAARLQYSSHATLARAPPMVDLSNPMVDDIAQVVYAQVFQDVPLVLFIEGNSQSAQKEAMLSATWYKAFTFHAARHADASGSAPNRTLTAVLYLNHEWDAANHGGHLCIYNHSKGEHAWQSSCLMIPGCDLHSPSNVVLIRDLDLQVAVQDTCMGRQPL